MKNNKIFLEDIISSINKIEKYIYNTSFEEFSNNDMIIDAVVRNLEIIGEAARYLEDDFREANARIPWRNMIGLRNIMIREYFGIDLNIIWKIVTDDIPKTKPEILKLI
ncbi:MAG: DUF86 domain-containing protein [Armatimonadetes bacterium]|nr:DUF86 domain-containing protein [Armatimonadota bacterium]